MADANKIEIRQIFLSLQKQMIARLSTDRANILHPGTKGNATELCWIDMLNHYLPKRYQVEEAFVLDSAGQISEQIDMVIFDRQYSPFLFNQDGSVYVPAESVYAILEVKQDLNRGVVKYAGNKAASVRRLKRTSAPIPYAAGEYTPKEPFEILSGIVTLGCDWNPPFGSPFEDAVNELSVQERVNLGCSLQYGSFELDYLGVPGAGKAIVHTSKAEDSLIFFFLHLMGRLQRLGTAVAIDIEEYAKSLENG